MDASFVHEGCVIDFTPGADVALGEVVVQSELVGVATRAIEANAPGALCVQGVFDIKKSLGVGSAIPVGSFIYWDAGAKIGTADNGGGANKLMGKSILDAADNDATVRVRLDQ